MKVILSVKDSVVAGVICGVFLVALSVGSLWWTVSEQNYVGVGFAGLFSIVCLGVVCIDVAPRIWKRRWSVLGVDGGSLVWTVSEWNGGSRKEVRNALPIASLKGMRVVVRKVQSGEDSGALDYGFADVFVLDPAGKLHQLPGSLLPGVYAKKIFEGIREARPGFTFEERILDS